MALCHVRSHSSEFMSEIESTSAYSVIYIYEEDIWKRYAKSWWGSPSLRRINRTNIWFTTLNFLHGPGLFDGDDSWFFIELPHIVSLCLVGPRNSHSAST